MGKIKILDLVYIFWIVLETGDQRIDNESDSDQIEFWFGRHVNLQNTKHLYQAICTYLQEVLSSKQYSWNFGFIDGDDSFFYEDDQSHIINNEHKVDDYRMNIIK